MTEIEKRVSSATSSADAFRHMQAAKEPLLVLSFNAGSIEGDLWFNEERKMFYAKSDGDGDNPLMAVMTLLAAKNATFKLDRNPPASLRGNVDIDITLMDLAERQPKVVQRIKDILWPVQEIESEVATDATQQALPPSMYQDLVQEAMYGTPEEPAVQETVDEVPQLIPLDELESYSLLDDAEPEAAPVAATAERLGEEDAQPEAPLVGATAERLGEEDAQPEAPLVGATAERLGGGDAEGDDDPRPEIMAEEPLPELEPADIVGAARGEQSEPSPALEEDMRPDDEVSFEPEEEPQSIFQPPEEVFTQPTEPAPEPIALRDLPEPPPVAEIIARELQPQPEQEPLPAPSPPPPLYSQKPAAEDMEQSIEEQSSRLPGGAASQRIFHQVIAASIEAGNTPSFLTGTADAQSMPAPQPDAPPATPPLNQSGRFQGPELSAATPFKTFKKRLPIGAITTTAAAVAIVCAIGFSAFNGITSGATASKDDTAAAVQFADDTLLEKAPPK